MLVLLLLDGFLFLLLMLDWFVLLLVLVDRLLVLLMVLLVPVLELRPNDIVLENRGVSRKHALIEFNDKAAIVIDNESLNGTFVNNRKITEEVLRDEDVITSEIKNKDAIVQSIKDFLGKGK